MFVTHLEIQGFKTFAKKTTLTFLPPKAGKHTVTAIVGPNGSGKSNIADAIRWVLGEQSLKLLRGKKSEDVIFSGSEGRGRSGFAEVSITMNNEDKAMPIDLTEITITRRLYRDGSSDYLVNERPARLIDIQLLLAQANVGQKSYSVVGQGMVDHILIATPEERKAFFDDATGVRQFHIKRHEAMLKLTRTYENLAEVQMLLQEIEPRLRSLKRQANRLEQREAIEKELRTLEQDYYGTLFWQLADQVKEIQGKETHITTQLDSIKAQRKELEQKFAALAADGSDENEQKGLSALQTKFQETQSRLTKLREQQFEAEKQIEIAKVRAQSNWAPLPLTQIIKELEGMTADQKVLLERVRTIKNLEALKDVQTDIEKVFERSNTLVRRLQRPSPEDFKPDPAVLASIEDAKKAQVALKADLDAIQEEMKKSVTQERRVRTDLLEIQQHLTQKQKEIHALEKTRNDLTIERTRLEERQHAVEREMDEHMKDAAVQVRASKPATWAKTDEIYPEIQKLRYKLELIGGIDPEVIKEFRETDARFEFLSTQVKDLEDGIKATEQVIDELDEEIRSKSEQAFAKINKEFQKFFKMLFGGGSCSLIRMTQEDMGAELVEAPTDGVSPDRVPDDTVAAERLEHESDTLVDEIKKRIKEREDRVVGIDIHATPPGKRLKALNLLSGGERALTSIALLSAIMAVNPSPFVLLDEVDAALDEANTYRFANILDELSKLTQFIIVTHNRATMEKAGILYGVTMGDDGVSNLLSVNLEDIKETATARR